MKKVLITTVLVLGYCFIGLQAQDKNPVIEAIIKEANENLQLENLGHEMLDFIGLRLVGTPAFNLSAMNWSYWNYTLHTNRDTYDKIIFDDVRNNAILTAILAYMGSEDDDKTSREKIILHMNSRTGEQRTWPEPRSPELDGGKD
jgi:hypothetical protein